MNQTVVMLSAGGVSWHATGITLEHVAGLHEPYFRAQQNLGDTLNRAGDVSLLPGWVF